jgi:hypothetical protein
LRSARDRAEQHVRDCERRLDSYQSIMDPGDAGQVRKLAGLRITLSDAKRCRDRIDDQIAFAERHVEGLVG